MVALMPRFSSTGLRVWPTSVSRREILHVASADLNHIGVLDHKLHAARVHDFRDHGQTMLVARCAENFQPLFAQSLMRVGARARFERAAPQDVRSRGANRAGDLVHSVGAFDGAWASDHRQMAAADFDFSHHDDRGLALRLDAGQLIRRQNRNDLGHAGNRLERGHHELGLVADHPDDRAIGAAAQMGFQPERLDPSRPRVRSVPR